MSDLTLEVLNRRVAVAAVRQEAARLGVDGDALLDSARFYDQVTGLDPDEAGFAGRVRVMVGEAAGRLGGRPAAEPGQDKQQGPRQWTLDDVEAASNDEVLAAVDAGLLTSLGVGSAKRRR